MNIHELIEKIENKQDFIYFLRELNKDFLTNGNLTWENPSLERYLDAMESFVTDSTDQSLHKIDFTPSWKLFAIILYTSSIYE